MKRLLPDVPCSDCLNDTQARAAIPIGETLYCKHRAVLTVWDDQFGCAVSFTGITLKSAAELVATAITDRLVHRAKPANDLPV